MDNRNYQKISHHLNAGKYKLVIQLCHKIKNLGERGDICYLLGLAYLKDHQPNLAVAPLEQAAKHNPDVSQIYFDLGIALMNTGNLSSSCNAFKQSLKLKPNYPAAVEKLGFILTSLGQHEKAIEILQKFYQKSLIMQTYIIAWLMPTKDWVI